MRFFSPISRAWRGASLRTQLVMITTGLLLLTTVITTFVSAMLFRQEMTSSLDAEIVANTEEVSNYIFTINDPQATDPEHADRARILRFYGWLMNSEGNFIEGYWTHNPESDVRDRPVLPKIPYDQAVERAGEAFNVPGTAEESRGFRVHIRTMTSGEATLLIALPLDQVETSVERASSLVATIGLLATLGASVIAYSLVTRSFRPLLRVEKTAAAIAGGDFSRRVETTAPPDTEIGSLAGALNTMLSRIEEAFDTKVLSEQKMRRFIQDASHELRTPLVTIRGFSELYRHGGLDSDEAVQAAMGRIESEATRLGHLVEDLLTLARLDEQRPMQLEPLDLHIIAHESLMDLAVNAPDREVSVIGLDGGSPQTAPILGDAGRIRQVVTNLVTNALRYTPDGSPLELAVGTQSLLAESPEAVLEVRDHGEGIAAEDAEKIFERFYRADNSRHRETGGTGLGLAICSAIAAQHGGSIRYAETPGGGATMRLTLPVDEDFEQERDAASLIDSPELDTGELQRLREAARDHQDEEPDADKPSP